MQMKFAVVILQTQFTKPRAKIKPTARFKPSHYSKLFYYIFKLDLI